MDESGRVQELHDGRHADDVLQGSVAADRRVRQECERGPHALAARSAQVVADVGDDLYVRARLPLELLLDEREFTRDETEDAPRRHQWLLDRRRVTGRIHKYRMMNAE